MKRFFREVWLEFRRGNWRVGYFLRTGQLHPEVVGLPFDWSKIKGYEDLP